MWRSAPIVVLGIIIGGSATAQSLDRPHAVALAPASNGPAAGRAASLPFNLIVPDTIKPLLTSTWQRSPTFRRQCARLAEHPEVVVQVELTVRLRGRVARSRVERRPEGLTAAMQIALREPTSYVELIAHELEHILEQLDGTDLARFARQRVDGVLPGNGQYETIRALSVGRAVAREAQP